MNTVTLLMSTLIDRTLEEVQAPNEVGRTVVLVTSLAAADTQSALTGTAAVTNVVEFGSELLLVTAKSSDVVPIYTFQRGYNRTTAAALTAGAVGYLDPQFPRYRVMQAVRRAFDALEGMGVPLIKSSMLTPEVSPFTDDTQLVLDPGEAVRDVLDVRLNQYSVPNWEFIDNVPVVESPSGNLIRLRWGANVADTFTVTYRVPYRWSQTNPIESSTIEVPEGAEFLPSAYAAAWLCNAREVSRHDLDRVSEWTEGEPTRAGVSSRMVQAQWQAFYRRLDEARRLNPIPKRRPYVRRARGQLYTSSSSWG